MLYNSNTKTLKLPGVGQGPEIFYFGVNTEFVKNIYREGSRIPATSETLLSVAPAKRLKAVRKSSREPHSHVAGFDNGPLIT